MENSNGKHYKHLSDEQMREHANRGLTAAETLSVDEHLAACDFCYEKFTALVNPRFTDLNLLLDEPAGAENFAHLSYEEELEPYVNGALNRLKTEKVEEHLQSCRMCSAELQDLQRFKISFEQSEKQSRQIAGVNAERENSLWRWLDFSRNPLRAGFISVALGILVLSAAFLFYRSGAENGQQIAENPANANTYSNVKAPEIAADQNILNADNTAANSSPEIKKPNERLAESKKPSEAAPAPVLTPELPREVELAIADGKLTKPKVLDEVAGNKVQLLGEEGKAESFSVQSPAASVIRNNRPVFRWQALPGANGYTVTVFDSNLNRVAKSDILKTNQWAMPSTLKGGEVYQWQVTAVKDGKEIIAPAAPAPEAKFKVLGGKELNKLNFSLGRAGSSHLARGILFARAGLTDDAAREFRQEIKRSPDSKIARRLLLQVQSWGKSK